MKADDKIVSMCLSGMIAMAVKDDRQKCLQKIKDVYGAKIFRYVKEALGE